MTRILVVQPAVYADVEEHVRFIARSSPQNARLFQRRVIGTWADLLFDPSDFRPMFPGDPVFRHVLHGRLNGQPNHLFFFRIDGDVVTILRVLHGARGDLRERLGEAAD